MGESTSYTDTEIIKKVKAGGRSFEKISEYLFDEYYGYVYKLSQKMKLEIPLANDAYADALVKLIRQLKNDRFDGKSKLSTYFYSIYKNTCIDVLRKKTTNQSYLDLIENAYSKKEKDLLNLIEAKDEAQSLFKKIDQMGDPCKKILVDWAYWGYSMREIAERCNLANEDSARTMKYKCLKKLRATLSQFKTSL